MRLFFQYPFVHNNQCTTEKNRLMSIHDMSGMPSFQKNLFSAIWLFIAVLAVCFLSLHFLFSTVVSFEPRDIVLETSKARGKSLIKLLLQIWHSLLQVKMDFHLWSSVVQSKICSAGFLNNTSTSSADLHILQQNLITISINPGCLVKLYNALRKSNFRNAWQKFSRQVTITLLLFFVQLPQGTTEAQLLFPPRSQ